MLNRRNSERHAAPLVISFQPLTAARERDGQLLSAVSLDVSQGGACFISDHPLLTDLAIVDIQAATSEQSITVLAKRIRCRRVSSMFEIAVQFVERLAPPHNPG